MAHGDNTLTLCHSYSSSKFRTPCESKPAQLSRHMEKTWHGWKWLGTLLCHLLWGRRATAAMSAGLNGHHFPLTDEEPRNNPFYFSLQEAKGQVPLCTPYLALKSDHSI